MNRKNPPVHNHGPEDGLGLSCPEYIVGGFLQGACVLAAEQTDPFSQSPHMASKYWAELVRARKRIAELEAAVTAPTEPAPPQTINGFTLEDWFKIAQGKDETVGVCVAAIDELAEAIRFTVEYVGNDTLPAIEGWSWFDALMKHRPEIAEEFSQNPILLHAKYAPTEVRDTPATGEVSS